MKLESLCGEKGTLSEPGHLSHGVAPTWLSLKAADYPLTTVMTSQSPDTAATSGKRSEGLACTTHFLGGKPAVALGCAERG